MEKLTTEQKLYIMREAKKAYINSIQGSDPDEYSVICGRLGYALENNGIVSHRWNSSTVQELFPELLGYKPEGVKPDDPWWPRNRTDVRLRVFDSLIFDYEREIAMRKPEPWYTKLFNQIKRLFSWKS